MDYFLLYVQRDLTAFDFRFSSALGVDQRWVCRSLNFFLKMTLTVKHQ
jgi:hypothetical protein